MKFSQTFALFALATQLSTSASIPEPIPDNALLSHRLVPADIVSPAHTLVRRKGGGGRGGSSSGGSSSSGGGRSSNSGSRTSSSSTAGGATRSGSGPARSFGGGRYYGGGAAVPYTAGARSPRGLVAGAVLAPLVVLSIMPGLWLYNCYPYYYNNPYRFYNQSAINDNDNDRRALWSRQTQTTGRNESLPVLCLCQDNSVCGCDENDDPQYLADLVGNGSYAALNKTLVTVADVNGTTTLVLNGTLPHGTTAPGGTDDEVESAAARGRALEWYVGYAGAVGVVVSTVLF